MTQPAINRAMSAREWTLLFALSVLWGGTFYFVAVAVKELPPLTLATARVVLAAAALYVFLLATGEKMPRDRASWIAFFGMGLLNNAGPFILLNWGQTHIPSGVASILLGTTPFFTAILAHFVTSDEKLTGSRLLGVTLGLAGITTIVGGSALSAIGDNIAGQLAIVGAAIGYSLSSLWGRWQFRTLDTSPSVAATGMLICSSLILMAIVMFDRPWTLPVPGGGVIWAVLGLALPSTALAYVIYFRLLRTIGATNLMLVTFMMPVTAIMLAVTLLGERLELRHILGMGLIALGLVAIDGRAWIAFRARK